MFFMTFLKSTCDGRIVVVEIIALILVKLWFMPNMHQLAFACVELEMPFIGQRIHPNHWLPFRTPAT